MLALLSSESTPRTPTSRRRDPEPRSVVCVYRSHEGPDRVNPLAPDRYCCIGRQPAKAMSTARAGSSPVRLYPQALESDRPTETELHKAHHRSLSAARAQSQKAEPGAKTLALLLARPAFNRAETALAKRTGRNTRHPSGSPVLLRSQSVPQPAPRLALRCSGHSVLSRSLL